MYKIIFSCNQCQHIKHSFPKFCNKYKKEITNTRRIPEFCDVKSIKYK